MTKFPTLYSKLTKKTTFISEYQRQLQSVSTIVNKHIGSDLSINSPITEISTPAIALINTEFESGIRLTENRTLSQISLDHPAQTLQEIISSPSLLYNSTGQRSTLEDYLRDRYSNLIEEGMEISIEYIDPTDVLRHMTARYDYDLQANFQKMQERTNLTDGMIEYFKQEGVKVPTLVIKNLAGQTTYTPITNNPISLGAGGGYGMFESIRDVSGQLKAGWISVKTSSFISQTDGQIRTSLFEGLSTLLHEIDHVILANTSSNASSTLKLIISEGLARQSQISFIGLQRDYLSSATLTQNEIYTLMSFATNHSIVMRDLSDPSVAIYGIGNSLIPSPNDDPTHPSSALYLDDKLLHYLEQNPNLILAAIQFYAHRSIDLYDLMSLSSQINNQELVSAIFSSKHLTSILSTIHADVNAIYLQQVLSLEYDFAEEYGKLVDYMRTP